MRGAVVPLQQPAPEMARLYCHATRNEGKRCDRFLGYQPGLIKFVGVAARAPDHPPEDRIWVRCTKKNCGAWNIFESVTA